MPVKNVSPPELGESRHAGRRAEDVRLDAGLDPCDLRGVSRLLRQQQPSEEQADIAQRVRIGLVEVPVRFELEKAAPVLRPPHRPLELSGVESRGEVPPAFAERGRDPRPVLEPPRLASREGLQALVQALGGLGVVRREAGDRRFRVLGDACFLQRSEDARDRQPRRERGPGLDRDGADDSLVDERDALARTQARQIRADQGVAGRIFARGRRLEERRERLLDLDGQVVDRHGLLCCRGADRCEQGEGQREDQVTRGAGQEHGVRSGGQTARTDVGRIRLAKRKEPPGVSRTVPRAALDRRSTSDRSSPKPCTPFRSPRDHMSFPSRCSPRSYRFRIVRCRCNSGCSRSPRRRTYPPPSPRS